MPELPEVETTVRALRPILEGRRITNAVVREPRLRWPVPTDLPSVLRGAVMRSVARRAKYILVGMPAGTLIIHLGMSGRFCLARPGDTPEKHDHVDIITDQGHILRYTDPRRFGAMLWTAKTPAEHPLIAELGPEPWDPDLSGDVLFDRSRRRTGPVKTFLMDGTIIVGVGNIYANEALFRAGIKPTRAANRVSRAQYTDLLDHVRQVLGEAIAAGGTTLRDFAAGERQAGYFRVSLAVYGRGGQPCIQCGTPLKEVRIANRSTVYCAHCQGRPHANNKRLSN